MKQNVNKRSFLTRHLKMGSYSLVLCAVVLVAVILVNALAAALPSGVTCIDLTSSALSELGETSRQYAAGVGEDVTLYLVATSGKEDSVTLNLLRRYSEINGKIKVKTVDPATNPGFLEQYGAAECSENSVIVVNPSETEAAARYRALDNYDLFEYYVAEFDQFLDYETAQRYYNAYLNYYQTQLTITQYFRGEQLITSALDYVTNASLPTVYVLTGHGETALSDAVTAMLEEDNMVIHADFSLLSAGAVPEDCSVMLINLPTKDLGETEAELLKTYLENDGTVLLVTGYASAGGISTQPQFSSLAAYMGLAAEDGYLCDGDGKHFTYLNNQYYALLPDAGNDGPFLLLNADGLAFPIINAHGITALPGYEGDAVLMPLLTTSASAYVKKGTVSSVSREEGDVEGQFYVGVASCLPDTDKNGMCGTFTWFASPHIEEELYANRDLFVSTVNWMGGRSTSISIASKVVETVRLDAMSETQVNIWSAVLLIAIPGTILLGGFVVWFRRRRH